MENFLPNLIVSKDYNQLTNISHSLASAKIAQMILMEFLKIKRLSKKSEACKHQTPEHCPKCLDTHFEKVFASVNHNNPVTFVLPAFPGKSPNGNKVLGVLPDGAERLALIKLGNICQKVKTYYPPGIKIIICSDGRVFSDIVGINENHLTAYQIRLRQLLSELNIQDITTFNLDDYYPSSHFIKMRSDLMEKFGTSLENLKNKVKNGINTNTSATQEEKDANRMYTGITRFLFEDAQFDGQTKSKTLIQKESKANAYEVVRRSNAWSELIAENFPNAVRLSIHPQVCGSKKLGIRLIGEENWMTPWHGVLVKTKAGPRLLKRKDAEALGAKLIRLPNGTPDHYILDGESTYEC